MSHVSTPVAGSVRSRPLASSRNITLVVVSVVGIVVAMLAGLIWGSHNIPLGDVVSSFTDYDPTNSNHIVVRQSRVPRVVLGLLVGAALGVAGLVMQSFTRNPIADPGILGVNAGAALAVVLAIAIGGVTAASGYVWFALGGAALGAIAVYFLGAAYGSAATPARMALAGAAFSMAVGSITAIILISYEATFLRFRYWAVGTLQGRGFDIISAVWPFIVVGLVVAFLLIRSLNALALGEDSARATGVNLVVARLGAVCVVVLLAGAATAAVGPIAFIGLAAAHIVRTVVGPDHRVLVPAVMLVGPLLLLTADVVGRIAVAPAELQTGIAATLFGGPLFVAMVRSRRLASL